MLLVGRRQATEKYYPPGRQRQEKRRVAQTLPVMSARLAQAPFLGVCDSAKRNLPTPRGEPEQCPADVDLAEASLREIADGKEPPSAPARAQNRPLGAVVAR